MNTISEMKYLITNLFHEITYLIDGNVVCF